MSDVTYPRNCSDDFTSRTARPTAFALGLFLFTGAGSAWASCTAPHSLQEEVRLRPSAETYSNLGSWFGDHHEYSCAADAFRKALDLQPDSARLAWLFGISLVSSGDPAAAIAPLRHAAELDPKSLNGRLALAEALDQANDRTGAEAQWRSALAGDPNSELALEHLSGDLLTDADYSATIALLAPLAEAGKLTSQLAVNLSVAYSKSGQVDDAVRILHTALQADPSSLALVHALAGALIFESRVQEATTLLASAVAQHPDDFDTQVLYLRTLVVAHDATAQKSARALLASHPHNWEVLFLIGLLREQEGDYAGARGYLQKSVEENPADPQARFHFGVVLAGLKENAAAKEQLEKAIALGLDDPEVHFELAKTLRALGESELAQQQVQLYQQTLETRTSRTQAASKAELGDQAEASGHFQQAAEYYREALTMNPKEPVLAYKLAMALDRAGDPLGERAALEQAIQIDPRMAIAHDQLGYLDFHSGDTASAIAEFQLAVQAYPGYTKAWMNLAAALCMEARWQDARNALAHVQELDPSNTAAKELSQRIDAMQASR
jgi:tetratricopeptide (TPR) repeat protein